MGCAVQGLNRHRAKASLVPPQIEDERKPSAIKSFLNWVLGPGQRQAAALGYLALPKEIVTREQALISPARLGSTVCFGRPLPRKRWRSQQTASDCK